MGNSPISLPILLARASSSLLASGDVTSPRPPGQLCPAGTSPASLGPGCSLAASGSGVTPLLSEPQHLASKASAPTGAPALTGNSSESSKTEAGN